MSICSLAALSRCRRYNAEVLSGSDRTLVTYGSHRIEDATVALAIARLRDDLRHSRHAMNERLSLRLDGPLGSPRMLNANSYTKSSRNGKRQPDNRTKIPGAERAELYVSSVKISLLSSAIDKALPCCEMRPVRHRNPKEAGRRKSLPLECPREVATRTCLRISETTRHRRAERELADEHAPARR